jgi:hypothetical protein
MPKFEVTFKLISSYEDEDENLEEIVTQIYDAESEEALDEALDEELEDDPDWDDECVINWDAQSELIESIRDWVSTKEIK